MDPLNGDRLAELQSLASRLFGNAYRLLVGCVPVDDPVEQARQRYYVASERHAVARDFLTIASLADWAALEPELAREAEALRLEARRMYDDNMSSLSTSKDTR